MQNNNDTAAASSAAGAGKAGFMAWYATVMLAFLYWLSILDRFIISLVVDPIKRDLGISDVQFGFLHGGAFAVAFALFGLIAGVLADRFNRRWVIFAGVTIWSLATAACGLANNFWHMLLARVGVGSGEAVLNPCATSMITDLFPRERLTSAMAVYAIGATLGSGCAYLIGGVIVSMVAQSATYVLPVIGEVRSWQAVFFLVGIPGSLLALLLFTVREPARRGVMADLAQQPFTFASAFGAYGALLRFMGPRRRFFFCHYAGFGLASMIISGAGTWYPAHMGRNFGWGASQIGLSLGLMLVTAGVVGKLICGNAVDYLYRRGYRDAQIRWYGICLLLALPFGLVATTSANPWVFLIGLGTFIALTAPLPACASAALNLATPNELRGSGVALFAATGGLIGAATGPVLIAMASDCLFGGGASIGLGIATMMAICCPLGAIALFCGLGAMRDAVAEAEALE